MSLCGVCMYICLCVWVCAGVGGMLCVCGICVWYVIYVCVHVYFCACMCS